MRISTKGQNAIKLMLDLATYSVGAPVKLKDIAKRQRISEKYLALVDVLHVLQGRAGEEIRMDEETRLAAKRCIDEMIRLG